MTAVIQSIKLRSQFAAAKGSTAESYATKYNKTFKEVSSSGVKGDANGDGVLRASDSGIYSKEAC